MSAENEQESCSQRDSAERKGYVRAHRSFNRIWKERDSAEPDILGKIPVSYTHLDVYKRQGKDQRHLRHRPVSR